MARNAGAKSMGMFVRQQLLEALGIDTSGSNKGLQRDLEPVKADLKRIHSELREFVAEALATYSNEFSLENEVDAVSVEFQEGLPFEVEDPGPGLEEAEQNEGNFPDRELEESAASTFAISPRLGVVEQDLEQEESLAGEESQREAELAGEQDRHESMLADKAEPQPEFLLPRAPAKTPWIFPNENEAALKEKRDPLSDLLEAQELTSVEEGSRGSGADDEDSFDVPLSILARRRQMQAQIAAVSNETAEGRPGENTKPALSQPPAKPDRSDKKEEIQKKDLEEKNDQLDAKREGEVPQTQDQGRSSGSFPVYNPLGNPDEDSPFSGGPPPKKRQ